MGPHLKNIIESLIFVSLESLSLKKIKSVLTEFTDKEIEEAIKELLESYSSNNRGIQIIHTGGGYLFSTKPENDLWIRRFLKIERKNRLSSAALEILSIVAYHQPITQAEISSLRGVDSTHSLKTLLHKKLIKITGRKKSPGNPLIYRTTKKFLTYFGLNNIEDLPSEEEVLKLVDTEIENR